MPPDFLVRLPGYLTITNVKCSIEYCGRPQVDPLLAKCVLCQRTEIRYGTVMRQREKPQTETGSPV